MQDFNSLFPHFLERCVELKSALMPVAYVLLVVGVISSTLTGRRSPGAYMRTFGRTIVYVMLLIYLVTWGNELTALTDRAVKEIIRADPAAVFEQYNAALIAEKSESEDAGWWDKLFHAGTTIFEAIVSGILWLFGLFASLILFLAYIVQKMVLYLGYSLSPIFIGFMAVRSLSHIGNRYLLGLVGVMAWPLGWAVAAIVSDGLLRFMTDQSFLHDSSVGGAIGYGLQDFVGLALLGVWLIFSTIAAPVIIQRALTEGYQVGSALVSGATTAGASGVSAGATTMATMAARNGSSTSEGGSNKKTDSSPQSRTSEAQSRTAEAMAAAGWTATAGAASALMATAASSLHGGQSGSLINNLAHMMPRPSEAPPRFDDDDITGSKAVNNMIQKSRQPNT